MSIFEILQEAVASSLGTTMEAAGFLLGLVVIGFFVALFWILASMGGNVNGSVTFLVGFGIGGVFSSLVGWWPQWTILAVLLLIALAVMMGRNGNGGGGL